MNKLEACVKAYRRLIDSRAERRIVSGQLSSDIYFETKELLDQFNLLHSHDDQTCHVEIDVPIDTNQLFAFSIDDLLSSPKRQLKAPENFYIADIDYLYVNGAEVELPVEVSYYLNVVKLCSALVEVSDHLIKTPSPVAIFLHEKKLELSLSYGKEELKDIPGVPEFISTFIRADIHKDQKATIIKKVLLEMLSSNAIDRLTLPCILKRFDEFVDRVKADYQLYVSEFSFEKIKAQVEQERFDFTIKINKVFADIQNQLLAIPVAVIIASSQITYAGHVTAKNTLIILGIYAFSTFMWMLVKNQLNSLTAIQIEVDFQWNLIKNQHVAAEDRLASYYTGLNARVSSQESNLKVVRFIVVGLLILINLFYCHNSGYFQPAIEKLSAFMNMLMLILSQIVCSIQSLGS